MRILLATLLFSFLGLNAYAATSVKIEGEVTAYYFPQPISKAAAQSQLFKQAQEFCESKWPNGGSLAIRTSPIKTTVSPVGAVATASFGCALPTSSGKLEEL